MKASYFLKKIVTASVFFIVNLAIVFSVIHLAPGDPTSFFFSDITAPPGAIEAIRREFGLDRPIYEQLFIYLQNMLKGNWGRSYIYGMPVFDLIGQRLSATLELVVPAFVLSISIGILIGVTAATRPYSKMDSALSTLSSVLYSTPQFWIGLIFLMIFGLYLRAFPIGGRMSVGLTGLNAVIDRLWHLVLPVTVLTLSNLAMFFRLTRASMLEQIRQDYILTARGKGCSPRRVYYYHAFRNALLPIVAMATMQLPWILAGAILIETVFSWPGIGMLLYSSILYRDFNVIMAIYAICAGLIIAFSVIGDILYGLVDPRIKLK